MRYHIKHLCNICNQLAEYHQKLGHVVLEFRLWNCQVLHNANQNSRITDDDNFTTNNSNDVVYSSESMSSYSLF